MKNKVLILWLIILCFGCKKNDTNSINQVELSKLLGKWNFISETQTGDDSSAYKYHNEYVTFENDGKAYPVIQGQTGSIYEYKLNNTEKNFLFQYVGWSCTVKCQSMNLGFWKDLSNGKGFIKEAKIHRLDDSFLVIGNTFTVYDTTMHKNLTVTIVDSLSR